MKLFTKAFLDNYNRVFNYIGGGADQQQLMMSLACKYTLAKKQFSGVLLQKVIEQIQEKTSKETAISSVYSISYRFAAQLILSSKQIEEQIHELNMNDKILGDARFKSSSFRTIGALFLQEDKEQHAARAKQLYVEMNRNQRILTSKEDIPYAIILTTDPQSPPLNQAATIIRYYNELRNHQFTMGNHLQALAQIMTLYHSDYNEMFLRYVVKLNDELGKWDIKVKRMHYPFLGVLALTATNEEVINEIVELYKLLMEQKIFKNAKQYALVVAIQKVIQDKTEVQEVINLTPLSHITDVLDIADIILELGWFIPDGISGIIDFFN